MGLRFSKSFCVLFAATLCQSALALADQRPLSIYGQDSRKDLYQVTDSQSRKLADSTVALMKNTLFTPQLSTLTELIATGSFGEDHMLCSDERFYNQKTAAFCSGSLVGPDLVMTAGHCIKDMGDCNSTNFVFGFTMNSADADPSQIQEREIYRCTSIVAQTQTALAEDFALVKLDRKVMGHRPLKINRSGELAKGTNLTVIGFPSGLPTKIADGKVLDTNLPGVFSTTLDTFAGNSGSAVFNTETGKIEGILVRGANDFEFDGVRGCQMSSHYSEDGTKSEMVTKIGMLAQLIPSWVNIPDHPTKCLRQMTTIEVTNVAIRGQMPNSVSDLRPSARFILDELVRKLSIGLVPSTTQTSIIDSQENSLEMGSATCQELRVNGNSELYEENGGHWQQLTGAGVIARGSRDLNGDLVPGRGKIKTGKLYLVHSTFFLQ